MCLSASFAFSLISLHQRSVLLVPFLDAVTTFSGANTAERRAAHNAVERTRRETLNGRFLTLASMLPPLAMLRRPSKAAIVHTSIVTINATRRHRVLAAQTLRALSREVENLRRVSVLLAFPSFSPSICSPSHAPTSSTSFCALAHVAGVVSAGALDAGAANWPRVTWSGLSFEMSRSFTAASFCFTCDLGGIVLAASGRSVLDAIFFHSSSPSYLSLLLTNLSPGNQRMARPCSTWMPPSARKPAPPSSAPRSRTLTSYLRTGSSSRRRMGGGGGDEDNNTSNNNNINEGSGSASPVSPQKEHEQFARARSPSMMSAPGSAGIYSAASIPVSPPLPTPMSMPMHAHAQPHRFASDAPSPSSPSSASSASGGWEGPATPPGSADAMHPVFSHLGMHAHALEPLSIKAYDTGVRISTTTAYATPPPQCFLVNTPSRPSFDMLPPCLASPACLAASVPVVAIPSPRTLCFISIVLPIARGWDSACGSSPSTLPSPFPNGFLVLSPKSVDTLSFTSAATVAVKAL
ncbi:hypothetical protein DFH06DRAFT_1319267 [Mycena polygramma]|nr:hypothetical protein DFH06DRAFT_1319267 [Mycena polygramma]